ncbi:MAG TPA: DUF6489 family protein [Parvibaculum sp.]
MKVKVDVDLTPEEARRLMGLPDLEAMQQRLLGQLEKQMASNLSYMDPEVMMKTILPAGAQGFEQFQNMLWGLARSAASGGKGASKKPDKPE